MKCCLDTQYRFCGIFIFSKMEEKEIWKSILGYEGLYEVSDLGNVKSLKRKNRKKEKLLKSFTVKGYFRVGLSKEGKTKAMQIHQLIAIAFLNHVPDGHRLVVDHINNIKTDNRLENLQIITGRENTSKDKKECTSKYSGVSWHKRRKKWVASIHIKDKRKHLGYFTDEIEASLIYQKTLEEIIDGTYIPSKPNFSSKYKGVFWDDKANKWRVSIRINGKQKYLGSFKNEYEAYLAYQKELNKK